MARVRQLGNPRNIEFALLLLVAGLYAFELAQIQLATVLVLRNELILYWAPPVVLAFLMHLILRLRASEADWLILPIGLFLNTLGISMIYRLDIIKPAVTASGNAPDLFAQKQVIYSVIAMAIAAAVILLVRSHLSLRKYIYVSMVAGVLLLLLPLLPVIGKTVSGARLWVGIGGFSFQPGELAKIALTIFFAGYLVSRRESLAVVGRKFVGIRIPQARELGPIVTIWLASLAVLVLQRDLGTSLLYFAIFLVLIYVATGRPFYVVVGALMFVTGALIASRLMSYVGGRVDSWLDPLNEATYNAVGGSYQLVQGLFGLAHGGLFGTGLGGGLPQLVPLAESDFIISSLGEELGLVGLFAIFALYLLLIARALRISVQHNDDFSKLLAIGFGFVIALQFFIVVGGVLRVLPLTGLTTPLLAAGGSSLIANWIIIALLLRISDSVPRLGVVSE